MSAAYVSFSSAQLKLIPFSSSPSFLTSRSIRFQPQKHKIEHITHEATARKPFNKSRKWGTPVSFFQSFLTKNADVDSLKKELFEAIAPLDRGAEASPEDQERVDQVARKLEAVNKVKEPLKSDLLNGKWELLYTTSKSVLQTEATANLVPLNAKTVAVKFDSFKIAGVIPIKSRGSGRGQLEITYLDEELRISRGNQGNLFILRMVDPSYRVPL